MPTILLAGLLVIAAGAPAIAAPGDLDTSFDGDGVIHTNFSSDGDLRDTALALALQSDGKVVAAGQAGGRGGRFALARYRANGTLDPTFGGDGKVLTDFSARADIAFGVAVQPDGKIVAAGRAGGHGGRIALVRYMPHGPLDASFGQDGKVVMNVTARDDVAEGLAIQPNGKILVVGYAGSTFAVVRFSALGRLGGGFAHDGIARTRFTTERDAASAIVLDPPRRIVVAGTAGMDPTGPGNADIAVARYLADGSLDATFDGDGKLVRESTSFGDVTYDVTIQPDRKILVVGTEGVGGFDTDTHPFVWRFDEKGTPDPTFSNEGVRTYNVTNRPDTATGVAVQEDGKIVVVGTSTGATCCSMAWLVRFQSNGDIDHTFGNNRVLTEPADAQGANDVVLQPDGRTVIAGRAGTGRSTFAVLRFLA